MDQYFRYKYYWEIHTRTHTHPNQNPHTVIFTTHMWRREKILSGVGGGGLYGNLNNCLWLNGKWRLENLNAGLLCAAISDNRLSFVLWSSFKWNLSLSLSLSLHFRFFVDGVFKETVRFERHHLCRSFFDYYTFNVTIYPISF
jgi:hypothetical protein